MADLRDFGLDREDLLVEEVIENAQGLTAFGLTVQDVAGPGFRATGFVIRSSSRSEFPWIDFDPIVYVGDAGLPTG